MADRDPERERALAELRAAQVDAAQAITEMARGKLDRNAQVRLTAACKVLELAREAQPGDQPSDDGKLAGMSSRKLAKLLALLQEPDDDEHPGVQ